MFTEVWTAVSSRHMEEQLMPQFVCSSFHLTESFMALRIWEQQQEQNWWFPFFCFSSVPIRASTAPCGAGGTDGNLPHPWPHNCAHIVIVKLSCIFICLLSTTVYTLSWFLLFSAAPETVLLPQLCRCYKYVFLMRHMAHSRAAPVLVSSLKMESFPCW